MTQPTLGQVLQLTAPNSVLTPDVIRRLDAALGSQPLSEITKLTGMALAMRLKNEVPDSARLGDLLAVAEAVLQQCVRAGSTASAAGHPSMNVTVQVPRAVKDMDLRELLTLLFDQPARASEILPYLDQQPAVRAAARKTSALAIVKTGKIDVKATLGYIAELARPHTMAKNNVDGVRPTTFAAAVGFRATPYMHPFTGGAVVGADDLGFDFGMLPEELHLALIWARTTRHAAWPGAVDRFASSTEVFTTPLPRRWQLILDDFRAAKAAQEPQAMATTRWALAGGATPFGGNDPEPERSESWYRQQLEGAAQGGKSTMSSDIRLRRTIVFGDLRAMSGDIKLVDCIVIGCISVMSGDLEGTVYIPKDYPLPSARSGDNDMNVYQRTYKGLYEKAKELRLL